MPADDISGKYPDDSPIDDLRDWIDKGPDEVDKVWGHIGARSDDTGEWDRFDFEILDAEGEQHTVSITPDDLGDLDWGDFFDWLEDYADENDIDYDNPYGEK